MLLPTALAIDHHGVNGGSTFIYELAFEVDSHFYPIHEQLAELHHLPQFSYTECRFSARRRSTFLLDAQLAYCSTLSAAWSEPCVVPTGLAK